MKKILMAALIATAIIPSMILAKNGADDHLEGGHKSSGHTGTTWTGMTHTGSVKPPMGSGSMMGGEIHALHMAMEKLSPADKAALVKMIRDYLTSKGITLPSAPVRQEIKEIRKEMKDEMKDIRKNTRDALKAKREAMQAKIKELRSNGKATFKEFTITK